LLDTIRGVNMSWDDALTYPLVLADGTILRTLKDAGNCLATRFATVRQALPLDDAVVLLMRASASGERADIDAATEQVAAVLRIWRLACAPATLPASRKGEMRTAFESF
jgi:hypothetical protein